MTRNQRRQAWRYIINLETVPKTTERLCRDCKQIKTCRWNSCFDVHGQPEYKTRCIDCYKNWEKLYRKSRRSKLAAYARKRSIASKQRCIEYLGGCCSRCGYSKSNRALTFHHISRLNKAFNVSQIKDRSWEVLKAELHKCELVCFNCHMEVEEIYDNAND